MKNYTLLLFTALSLTACGGGGSSDEKAPEQPPVSTPPDDEQPEDCQEANVWREVHNTDDGANKSTHYRLFSPCNDERVIPELELDQFEPMNVKLANYKTDSSHRPDHEYSSVGWRFSVESDKVYTENNGFIKFVDLRSASGTLQHPKKNYDYSHEQFTFLSFLTRNSKKYRITVRLSSLGYRNGYSWDFRILTGLNSQPLGCVYFIKEKRGSCSYYESEYILSDDFFESLQAVDPEVWEQDTAIMYEKVLSNYLGVVFL